MALSLLLLAAAAGQARAGLVVSDTELRWPGGIIPYQFEAGFSAGQAVLDAMREWERRTPLRFVPRNSGHANWVRFEDQGPRPLSSWSSDNGMAGGKQEVKLQSRGRNAAQQLRSALHEIGHVIGLRHEHQRPDRDDFLDWNLACNIFTPRIAWYHATLNYNRAGDSTEVGPYDLDSIMQYPSPLGIAGCRAFVRRDDSNLVAPGGRLSQGDVESVFLAYSEIRGRNRADDRYGAPLLSFDFDRDGIDDLVVGAPNDESANDLRSGVVYVYKGTQTGPVIWKRIVPPDPQAGQRFGAALAARDFNDDCPPGRGPGNAGGDCIELAVGAPGTAVDGMDNAGAVYLFHMTRDERAELYRGFDIAIMSGMAAAPDDRLGHSLAAGRFFRRGETDLAIGMPGAPLGAGRPGDVVFMRLADDVMRIRRLNPNEREKMARRPFGQLGWALAAFRVPTRARDALAVSAPGYRKAHCRDRTAVYILAPNDLRGGDPVLAHTIAAPAPTAPPESATAVLPAAVLPRQLECFGEGVALLRLAEDAPEVDPTRLPGTITPEELAERGRDEGRPTLGVGARPPLEGLLTPRPTLVLFPGDVEQYFGATLLAADLNGDLRVDLAVGVPAEWPGGAVYLYRLGLTDDDLTPGPPQRLDSAVAGAAAAAGDRFGGALAAGDRSGDGSLDLMVGAPGRDGEEAADAGRMFFFNGTAPPESALILGGDNNGIGQATSGLEAPGDHFGAAIAMGDFAAHDGVGIMIGAPGDRRGNRQGVGSFFWVPTRGEPSTRTRARYDQRVVGSQTRAAN